LSDKKEALLVNYNITSWKKG